VRVFEQKACNALSLKIDSFTYGRRSND